MPMRASQSRRHRSRPQIQDIRATMHSKIRLKGYVARLEPCKYERLVSSRSMEFEFTDKQ